ncbi:MAG: alpha/beta hydrolase [Prochlorococcaceae cyanobacterium]
MALALVALSQLYATAAPRSPAANPSPAGLEPKSPSRASTGAGVWTTSYAQLLSFLVDGKISDRSLAVLVARSGWSAEPLRRALIKPYSIDLALLAAYLRSREGEQFLSSQVGSYAPFAAPAKAVEGLRSALLADAADGTLSAAGVMAQLPTDFRLARIAGVASGAMDTCSPQLGALPGEDDQIDSGLVSERRTSLLSWYAFLPACLQERSYRPRPAQTPASP